jgi:hypothetical protein
MGWLTYTILIASMGSSFYKEIQSIFGDLDDTKEVPFVVLCCAPRKCSGEQEAFDILGSGRGLNGHRY